MTSPKASPISPGEELANEQRTLPPAQPVIPEEETSERESPPASAEPGTEAADPVNQGTMCTVDRNCDVIDHSLLNRVAVLT